VRQLREMVDGKYQFLFGKANYRVWLDERFHKMNVSEKKIVVPERDSVKGYVGLFYQHIFPKLKTQSVKIGGNCIVPSRTLRNWSQIRCRCNIH
jgi:hypothetical protein